MVTENLQQIKVSVSSLVVRNGIYQAVLEYYDENGKRQQPWRSTGLKERGNKKQATRMMVPSFSFCSFSTFSINFMFPPFFSFFSSLFSAILLKLLRGMC